MKMTLHQWKLPLARTFTISRESMEHQSSVIVELEHDGHRGLGEVTANAFYGHCIEQITANLKRAESILESYSDQPPDRVWDQMLVAVANDRFAASALDMAAHDLHGQRLGIPTWQAWELTWDDAIESSYTIGIDSPDAMAANLSDHKGWSFYKIKLGTQNDLAIIRRLRDDTDATFRVDANCGWSAEQTVEYSHELASLGVEFIEQPLPIDASAEDKQFVFEKSALPIIADEDCQVIQDVHRCEQYFHGVNVKVCKCGGLTPALAMLRQAKELGLKTMVGCMVETAIGISGAAQLLPLLDYVDLDGAVLLHDQPATGVVVDRGKIKLADQAGNGAAIDYDRTKEFLL